MVKEDFRLLSLDNIEDHNYYANRRCDNNNGNGTDMHSPPVFTLVKIDDTS
jgi:hypothetical protein